LEVSTVVVGNSDGVHGRDINDDDDADDADDADAAADGDRGSNDTVSGVMALRSPHNGARGSQDALTACASDDSSAAPAEEPLRMATVRVSMAMTMLMLMLLLVMMIIPSLLVLVVVVVVAVVVVVVVAVMVAVVVIAALAVLVSHRWKWCAHGTGARRSVYSGCDSLVLESCSQLLSL